jgi:hypothetical protein
MRLAPDTWPRASPPPATRVNSRRLAAALPPPTIIREERSSSGVGLFTLVGYHGGEALSRDNLYPVTCAQFLTARPMIIRITLLAARQEPAPLGKCSARLALQLAAFPPRRDFHGAAWMFSETVLGVGPSLKRIVPFAARQEPASLEEPQGRTAGPALQAGWVGLASFEGQGNR